MLLQSLENADPSKEAVSRPFYSAGIDNITVRLTDFGVGKTPRIEALDNNSELDRQALAENSSTRRISFSQSNSPIELVDARRYMEFRMYGIMPTCRTAK